MQQLEDIFSAAQHTYANYCLTTVDVGSVSCGSPWESSGLRGQDWAGVQAAAATPVRRGGPAGTEPKVPGESQNIPG